MKRLPLIIDADPGIDDALALFLAFSNPKKIEIKLITSALGNMKKEIVLKNCLYLVEKFSPYHIPVAGKPSEALSQSGVQKYNEYYKEIGGNYALGLNEPKGVKQKPIKDEAVEAIYKTLIASNEKIILISLGSLSNLANLLLKHPDCKEKIKYIFAMAGSIDGKGNATAYAEFNVCFDPKSLDIVLKSGVNFILSPLHLGLETAVANEKFYSHKQKTFKDKFIYNLIKGSWEPMQEGFFGLHDPQVIYGLLHPKLYKFKKCDIKVNLSKKYYGQTLVSVNPNGKHIVQLAKSNKRISKKMFKDFYR